ncbi:hypothetical protein BDW60DRAFT_180540 [Aspergillus nidulans var. acristatus]
MLGCARLSSRSPGMQRTGMARRTGCPSSIASRDKRRFACIGQGLISRGVERVGARLFQDNMDNLKVDTPSMAMQLCEQGDDKHACVRYHGTSNGTFGPIQMQSGREPTRLACPPSSQTQRSLLCRC